jgi:hypothetical protein
MSQVTWHPEIGARVLPTQHKVDFQHSTFQLLTYCRCLLKVCVENFQNLERSMSYAFSIAMHCVCLQAGRPKWVHAQDPKHRINYARPNIVLFLTIRRYFQLCCCILYVIWVQIMTNMVSINYGVKYGICRSPLISFKI